jgi:hypothetical protein
MIPAAINLILLVLAFVAASSLLFTALRPRPGWGTYCARCGCPLVPESVEICPQCRRQLSPLMRVTCTQSALRPGRVLLGLALVALVALVAPRILGGGR